MAILPIVLNIRKNWAFWFAIIIFKLSVRIQTHWYFNWTWQNHFWELYLSLFAVNFNEHSWTKFIDVAVNTLMFFLLRNKYFPKIFIVLFNLIPKLLDLDEFLPSPFKEILKDRIRLFSYFIWFLDLKTFFFPSRNPLLSWLREYIVINNH